MIYKIETDDREEFSHYYNGPRYHSALCKIVNELRSKAKYAQDVGSWDEAYQLVNEFLVYSNIDLF